MIELSIVMVIIALVIGGVMAGKDLIESSKVRAQIAQIIELETNINSFKGKYNCLPGDCEKATQFFGTTDANGNTILSGNGNGVLKSDYGAAYLGGPPYAANDCRSGDVQGELAQLFLHTDLAGISRYGLNGGGTTSATSGAGKAYPLLKYNSNAMYITCLDSIGTLNNTWAGQFNVMIIGGLYTSTLTRVQYSVGIVVYPNMGIPPLVAYQIDTKLDDGNINNGKMGGLYDCNSATISSTYTDYGSVPTTCNMTLGKRYRTGL